jgi:MFS family permease
MGIGTLLCNAAALLALLIGWHAPWYFTVIFLLLAIGSNMTAVYLALISETNPLATLGVCTSFGNFLAYMLVALLGNFAGLLMDAFPSSVVDGVRIYSPRAYAAVFGLFTALAFIGFLFSLTVRESRGQRIEVP